jgi:hypothetical protein
VPTRLALVPFTLRSSEQPGIWSCGVCGRDSYAGPQEFVGAVRLVRVDDGRPVCNDCGTANAPGLEALIGLAYAANGYWQGVRAGRTTVPGATFAPDAVLGAATGATDRAVGAQALA